VRALGILRDMGVAAPAPTGYEPPVFALRPALTDAEGNSTPTTKARKKPTKKAAAAPTEPTAAATPKPSRSRKAATPTPDLPN
jgi:hypothetical protein